MYLLYCATIKYTLIRGTNCNFPFCFQLHKALATFIYSIKIKTAQCFGIIVLLILIIVTFKILNFFTTLSIIQLCGSVCFGV